MLGSTGADVNSGAAIVKTDSHALLSMGCVQPVSLDGTVHGATSSARMVTMASGARRNAHAVGMGNHVILEQGSVGTATQAGLELSATNPVLRGRLGMPAASCAAPVSMATVIM